MIMKIDSGIQLIVICAVRNELKTKDNHKWLDFVLENDELLSSRILHVIYESTEDIIPLDKIVNCNENKERFREQLKKVIKNQHREEDFTWELEDTYKNKILIADLLVEGVNYAVGRRTYIVSLVSEMVLENINLLSERERNKMVKCIHEHSKIEEGLGSRQDAHEWNNLRKELEK